MFTIEREFGILGYGFWFKLLEILGNTEGHFIDAEEVATMKYLQAQTYTDEETCLKILNLLSGLGAIDLELWKQNLIWSDNFVSGLAPCYRNRNIVIPVKPDNYRKKPGQPGINGKLTGEEGEEEKRRKRREDIPPPSKSKKTKKEKTPIPEDFGISETVRAWAQKHGFGQLEEHLAAFKRKAAMNGYVYLNWDMAFMEAIREDWAKIRQNRRGTPPPKAPGGIEGKYDGFGTTHENPD